MKLSIFTPTYNRAYSLTRVYESLMRQTDKRFEWLIIDDGSTDNTENLIKQFIKGLHEFEIRYYKQEHKGKPSAQNLAIDLANGDFFITCDSNKYMDDHSVENILKMATSVVNEPWICGVGGYRADFSGKIYGGEMLLNGHSYIDCSNLEREKYHLLGDKATAFRTDILKKYKSPIFPGETFITEAVWLIPMADDGYKVRWFPQILCYGEYEKNGLTASGANSYIGHYNNFMGYLAYVNVYIKAYGIEKANDMILEATDIAKHRKISLDVVSNKIGCRLHEIYLLVFKKKILNIYNKTPLSKQGLKKMLGDNTVDKIKKILYKNK